MAEKLRKTIINQGFLETLAGDFVNLNNVLRIVPNPKNRTADCKDVYGNKIAVIPWPEDRGR